MKTNPERRAAQTARYMQKKCGVKKIKTEKATPQNFKRQKLRCPSCQVRGVWRNSDYCWRCRASPRIAEGYIAPFKTAWEPDMDWVESIVKLGKEVRESVFFERKRKNPVIVKMKESSAPDY